MVAEATGISEDPTAEVVDRLTTQLRDRDLVLIFDGCDDAVVAVRDFADRVLSDCPGVRVICTTGATVRLPDEAQLVLSGIEGPPGDPHAPAVAMFIDRVRARRPSFDPDPAERATVAALVDALDRLPLAVELAAARAATASVAEVLKDISAGMDLRAETATPRRQTSLHTALDWTLARLPEPTNAAIGALAQLPGQFLAETAAAVTGISPDSVGLTLDDLTGRALVQITHTPVGTSFAVTPATRRHLTGRLPQLARQRAITYHRDLAARIDTGLRGTDQLAWLARGDLEADNLAAALHHALDTRPFDALAIASGLARYWDWRGHVARAHTTLTTVLGANDLPPTHDAVSARSWAAFFTWESGALQRAADLAADAVALADTVGDVALQAVAAGVAALIARTRGDTPTATHLMRTALDRAHEPSSWNAAWLATALAPCELELGDDHTAARLARDAQDTFRRLGDHRGEGWALVNRALVLEQRDFASDATAAATSALLLADGVEDARTVASATELLARLAHADGDLEHASALLGAVDALQLRRGAPGPPSKDPGHLQRILDLEDRLGHTRFTIAWRHGATAGPVALART